MRNFGLFLHVASASVWLGASLSFMIFGPASRKASLESRASIWGALARVQRGLVAPAAAISAVTGILLTMSLVRTGFDMGSAIWLMVMQGLGLLAAVLAIVFATPLVNRMAAITRRSAEQGLLDPAADKVRRALAVVGSLSGVLILIAMWFGVVRS